MIRNLFIVTVFIFLPNAVNSQDILDLEKNKEAELFVMKKGYDVQERLKEISAIVGKEVTVYSISGKKNTIKNTYTGIAEMAQYTDITDKSKAKLITVKVTSNNGTMNAYFPLTYDPNTRIYLTEKMK